MLLENLFAVGSSRLELGEDDAAAVPRTIGGGRYRRGCEKNRENVGAVSIFSRKCGCNFIFSRKCVSRPTKIQGLFEMVLY